MVAIARAVASDAGEILTVQRAAFVTEAQLHDDVHMPPLTQSLADVADAIRTTTVLVARDGARLVGSMRARLIGREWFIGRLVVVPDRQGEGIGSALLDEIEALAPGGAAVLAIETGPKSATNVGLYSRRGYRQVPNDSILIRLTKDIR